MMGVYERALRELLAKVYTPEGVEVVMRSKLTLPGAPPWSWTWREYVAYGMGDVVLDWAESLTGQVAT